MRYLIFILNLIAQSGGTLAQEIDTTSFKLYSRLNFYSFEKEGEILLHIPPSHVWKSLNINLISGDSIILGWKGIPRKNLLRLPVDLTFPAGVYRLSADITPVKGLKYAANTSLIILNSKENEVKTDRYTGGMIVNRRIFFPFGFYCYSPVQPTLPEEEVVKGFNMISPYQKIIPENFKGRKRYMDRCAELGMKVHYNLLSVTGGGGVSSRIEGLTSEQTRQRLIDEIVAFRDHPALLAWYISDEPTGNKVSPEALEEIYKIVKENDPWHPVSIVFMAPFLSSVKYANATDIVMADPYPVPNSSINQVGNVAGQLELVYNGKKPVWIVPQAFGGGEWWGREPSLQELRSMTYQSVVNGATGIQYFIRHGLNSFPKSAASWNECGRIAAEIAEITPWLLSDEDPVPVQSDIKDIQVASFLHDGRLLIVAVSKVNAPSKVQIRVPSGNSAMVLFENRTVKLSGGLLSDYLQSYGSQVYLIDIVKREGTTTAYRGNLLLDPGFEDITNPGIPASCYAWNEGDRGSTFFLDTREHFEGDHSLRLVTPQENKGCRLRFFPVRVTNGRTYVISVRAKTDSCYSSLTATEAESGSLVRHPVSPYFEVGLGEYGKKKFYPGTSWKEFITTVTIPADNILPDRMNVILRMPGAGTAWFDMLQIFEATDINRSVDPELSPEWNY